jgi:hypothetical protein
MLRGPSVGNRGAPLCGVRLGCANGPAIASVLEEDGETTSLCDLEQFANRESAFAFSVRCSTAFTDAPSRCPNRPALSGVADRPVW